MSRKPRSPLARTSSSRMAELRTAAEKQMRWRRNYTAGLAAPTPPHSLAGSGMRRFVRMEESSKRWMERHPRDPELSKAWSLELMRRRDPDAYETNMLRQQVAELTTRVDDLEKRLSA